MPGWNLVVVGDMKTPHHEYDLPGVTYLHPQKQATIDPELSNLIGWNCIQRRNMGFVYALQQGAEIVATVDDDNDPKSNWGNVLPGEIDVKQVNPIGLAFDPLYHHKNVWHRGLPAECIATRRIVSTNDGGKVKAGVVASLWNGDPDIDALCRLQHPDVVEFAEMTPYIGTKPAPFNSQNTILTADALRDYFCFPGIGRYDDIYASYVCQAYGHKVVFTGPTVTQKRAGHDLLKDFEAEVYGYLNCGRFVSALSQNTEAWRSLPAQAVESFERYRELRNLAS